MAANKNEDLAQEQNKFGEILKLLRKKKPLNCAVRIGGPAGIVLEADKKKKPPALRKLAKTNGGGPKGVSGVISLEGKVIKIQTIEEEFPGALEKLMKSYFRDMNQAFRVEIVAGSVDENGVDDDDEDDEAAPEAAQRSPQPSNGAGASPRAAQAQTAEPPPAARPSAEASGQAARTIRPEAVAGQAQTGAAPARSGAVQSALMDGLRNMKPMLQNVASNGSPKDAAMMKKLSDGFKKAVKSSDEAMGQKILAAMTRLSEQIASSGPARSGAAEGNGAAEQRTSQDATRRRTQRRANLESLRQRVSQLMSQFS